MMHTTLPILAMLTAASVALYLAFFAMFLWGSRRAIRPDAPPSATPPADDLPPVSILKPCAGVDDALEDCLESYCRTRYPRFEILCGVRDARDPAYAVLQRVRDRHPEIDLRIVETAAGTAANPKVAQLEILARHARHAHLWWTDSNTRAHPDTLASMMSDLSEPGVGLVVSPIVGTHERSAGAALDNVQLAANITRFTYALDVLAHRVVAAGKSMLIRRAHLALVGGFGELGQYLAEDHMLVEKLRAAGLRTRVGRHLIANVNASASVDKYMDRHLRWLQMRWLLAAPVAALEPLMYPLLPALAWFVSAPSLRTLTALAGCLALQIVGDLATLAWLRGGAVSLRRVPLLALRPVLMAWVWVRSTYDRRVNWRGNVRYLGEETRIVARPRARLAPRAARARVSIAP